MNILGVIPAKGKNQGLKDKNIRPLLGKPTIYYTIQTAKESQLLDRIVCSTEDPKIAAIVKKYGVEVIKRPKTLSQKRTRVDDVLRHAVRTLEKKQGFVTDVVVLLYANVPVRKEGIIDQTISRLLESGADCVMTVEDIGQFHPNWLLKLDEKKKIKLYSPITIYTRQDLPKYYLQDGGVIAIKKDVLMRNDGIPLYPAFGKDIRAIIQSPQDVVDIDNKYDFLLAETILKTRYKK